ncbi:MAG: 4Fe-4S dicluster domain-containing protein [Bacteroidota bacterium]
MKKFGYKINKDRQIVIENGNVKVSDYLKHAEPSFNICISCGTCTATCSAGNFTDLNFRRMMLLIRRGEIENINEEIKKCMLCGKCFLVCPRGVNTRKIILKIKELDNS